MGFVTPEQIAQAKEIDLLTYFCGVSRIICVSTIRQNYPIA